MQLHQIKIEYRPEQDRLLFLASTREGTELRLWLTRRLTKLLWPLLVKLAADATPRVQEQTTPEARKALLGFEHEAALSKSDFSKPYQSPPRDDPKPVEPLLVTRIQTGRNANGQAVVALHPAEGQAVTLALESTLLHALCRLIQSAMGRSDWDLTLALPGSAQEPTAVPPVVN